ncbi:MAG: hypothetical protein ACJAUG_002865 [Halioglobus sp.]|jgi:hypothetical protein
MHPKIEAETRGYGDTFFIDEVFVKINGKQHEYRKDKRPSGAINLPPVSTAKTAPNQQYRINTIGCIAHAMSRAVRDSQSV